MLVRAAGRRQRQRTARLLDISFAQLNLPWLAPAQLRWSASQATTAKSTPPRNRNQESSNIAQANTQIRHLATATEQLVPRYPGQYPPPGYASAFRNSTQDQNIPWDSLHPSKSNLSYLRPYDDPIVINTSTQEPDKRIKVEYGINGTATELLQHLHTSLQIGRLNRAEAIIRRLGELCSSDSPELLYAHTAYLEESLRTVASHGVSEEARTKLTEMQNWFEAEIRDKGVPVHEKMLVVMIRAAIRALGGRGSWVQERRIAVRMYTDMAREKGDEFFYNVLEAEDYDDREFTIVGRIAYNGEEAQEEPADADAEEVSDEAPALYRRKDVLPMEEVPEVTPVQQLGDGLVNIKKALHEFVESPSLSAEAPVDEQYEQALKRQETMERTTVEVAIERWRKADEELRKIGIHTSMQSKPISALMWQWYCALVPALQQVLADYRKMASQGASRSDREELHYGPYLELLQLDKIAATTIIYTLTKMASGKNYKTRTYESEMKLAGHVIGLASAIETDCKAESNAKSQASKEIRRTRDGKLKASSSKMTKRRSGRKLSKAEQARQAVVATLEWPLETKTKLGAMLVSKLIETAQLPVTRLHPRTKEKITQMQPAFLHRWKYDKGKKLGMLAPNPALLEKIESEPVGSLIAKRMPMVVEPKPWRGWTDGGYLHYPTPVMRLPEHDRSAVDYFMAAHNRGDIDQVYKGLTTLGSVPWKIHHGVFKVQLEAWNSGEQIGNLAPSHPKLDLPPEPEDPNDEFERKRWLAEMRDVENKRAGIHSKRCFQNFQMEVARSMVNDTLYLPHNLDFRGRAYPIPPYLNHMGADNVRGLLVFANGKELGPHGLRWLKIHLATVAGHDKASMSERVAFTEKHIDDIYDSVRNPLGGRRWWLESEDAWQTMAACFELTEALDSPDPAKFVSHLPIQQDGTCNGLQHYAALGGDKIGAAQVNLEPGDRPADVYTAVAEAVKEQVRRDAAQGNAVAQRLDGNLTRKCVKQPVMTNVYGVTWFGAREQVRRQLENIFPDSRKSDEVNLHHMAIYVTTKIFESLGEMFQGAQAIQRWLGQCADRISTCLTPEQIEEMLNPSKSDEQVKVAAIPDLGRPKKKKAVASKASEGTVSQDRAQHKAARPLFKSTVVWTTPLRLPVVQPYRSEGTRAISTNMQKITVSEPAVWQPVSKRKQLQAFPPNFIHSLDATHMLLSALKCKELNMTFASIHDSFWTHACDVDSLSRVLRDSFIEMHKDNIIGRLREEFQTRYGGSMYLASVYAHSPVGKKITQLRKEHKWTGSNELIAEAQRLRLLSSKSLDDRTRGEAMITPGSILAAEGDEDAFALASEIESQQLGIIPDSASADTEDHVHAKTADADSDPEEVLDANTNTDSDPLEHDGTADLTEPQGQRISHETLEESGSKAEKLSSRRVEVDPKVVGAEAAAAAAPNESGKVTVTKPEKPRKKYPRKIFVWMPLTFPEVPPKGDFDVRKIRDSHYFFH